ncbi:hypothetical protein [Streptomyces sp. NPDC005969]|uniref:hypothetical protein n=1 Tax=Streptomyces sp. NPDC005969 TaxID=3156722 RepID=UPI0033C1BD8E
MALDSSLCLHLTDQFVHMHGYRPSASEVQVLETLPDGRTLRLHEALLREQFTLGTG